MSSWGLSWMKVIINFPCPGSSWSHVLCDELWAWMQVLLSKSPWSPTVLRARVGLWLLSKKASYHSVSLCFKTREVIKREFLSPENFLNKSLVFSPNCCIFISFIWLEWFKGKREYFDTFMCLFAGKSCR